MDILEHPAAGPRHPHGGLPRKASGLAPSPTGAQPVPPGRRSRVPSHAMSSDVRSIPQETLGRPRKPVIPTP